jgi:hypothetical protein
MDERTMRLAQELWGQTAIHHFGAVGSIILEAEKLGCLGEILAEDRGGKQYVHYLSTSNDGSGGQSMLMVMERGADVNTLSRSDRWPPARYAIASGNTPVLEVLVLGRLFVTGRVIKCLPEGIRRADPNWVDPVTGLSLLQFAAVLRDWDACRVLMEVGADVTRVVSVDTQAILSTSEEGRALLWARG